MFTLFRKYLFNIIHISLILSFSFCNFKPETIQLLNLVLNQLIIMLCLKMFDNISSDARVAKESPLFALRYFLNGWARLLFQLQWVLLNVITDGVMNWLMYSNWSSLTSPNSLFYTKFTVCSYLVHFLSVIIWLMLSVSLSPKVITLRDFHCIVSFCVQCVFYKKNFNCFNLNFVLPTTFYLILVYLLKSWLHQPFCVIIQWMLLIIF